MATHKKIVWGMGLLAALATAPVFAQAEAEIRALRQEVEAMRQELAKTLADLKQTQAQLDKARKDLEAGNRVELMQRWTAAQRAVETERRALQQEDRRIDQTRQSLRRTVRGESQRLEQKQLEQELAKKEPADGITRLANPPAKTYTPVRNYPQPYFFHGRVYYGNPYYPGRYPVYRPYGYPYGHGYRHHHTHQGGGIGIKYKDDNWSIKVKL